MRKTFKILGIAAGFLLVAWWAVAALGVAEAVRQLLWSSLTEWHRFTGFRRLYLLGGAITVLIFSIAYVIPFIIAFFRDFAHDWIGSIFAVVTLERVMHFDGR